MHARLFATIFASFPIAFGPLAAHAAGPDVVASIHPVQSLVAAVMDGVGTPHRLLPPGASPHSYALKPSEARLLSKADVIFRIHPALESFLNQPLENLPQGARIVTLAQVPGTESLPARAGGAWEDDHDDDDHHHHGTIDGHLWLDPRNASAWTASIAATLAEADPDHAGTYSANADKLQERLRNLEKQLADQLAAVRGTPYLVFHDAYQYFEHRFGLNAVGAVTVSPDRLPGARRISELRDLVRDSGAVCVFSEPQFEPRLVSVVIEDTDARSAVLDPLGAALPAGPDLYPTLLENLADSLTDCLSRR